VTDETDAADSTAGHSGGLLTSLRRLLTTLIEILHTRIEILSVELEEEGVRIRELIIYTLLSIFFLGFGLLLLTLLVVMVYWDTHRLSVLAGITAFYLLIGSGAALLARHKLKTRPGLFATTLAELGKDREHMDSRQ
jgi:uncharacterized membrane protein YqjE